MSITKIRSAIAFAPNFREQMREAIAELKIDHPEWGDRIERCFLGVLIEHRTEFELLKIEEMEGDRNDPAS